LLRSGKKVKGTPGGERLIREFVLEESEQAAEAAATRTA